MPRYAKLTRIIIHSEDDHQLGGVTAPRQRLPRYPKWTTRVRTVVERLYFPALRAGSTGWSLTGMAFCGTSTARLERQLTFLPRDGQFYIELCFEARGKRGLKRYGRKRFAYAWRKLPGTHALTPVLSDEEE